MLLDAEKKVFLVVGLGNPGREYRKTRHNAGFMVLDRLAERLGESFSRYEQRALVSKCQYQQNRLILAKPQTYMNESGQAVGGLLRYYQIQIRNMLIVYDEVDLPLGTLRIRPSGGSAGHKGMESIIQKINTEEFSRMRIGIGRPHGRMEAGGYVLQEFTRKEAEQVSETLDSAVAAILTFVTEGVDKTMNEFNAPSAG